MSPSAESLVEEHLDALHGLARAWTRDADLAAELTHRTFLKAIEKRGQLRDPGAARAWLVTILRREIASEFRRRKREVPFEAADFEDLPDPGETGDTTDLEGLPAAFERLAAPLRDILLLRFQQELSYEAIGRALALPLGTVMSRLHRAKTALRKHLADLSEGGMR